MPEEPKFTRVLTAEQRQSISNLLSAVDQDGDGTLDEYELHSVLIANGILVPIDVVLALFHAADVNGDGQLSLEEFGQFVIGPESDGFQRKDLWKAIRSDIFFWLNINFVIAGVLYTVPMFPEAFNVPTGEGAMAGKNMFLVGGLLFFSSGIISLTLKTMGHYKAEQSFEKTSKKLLNALDKNASEYTPLPPDVEEQAVQEKDVQGQQDIKVQAAEEQEPQEQVADAKEQEPQEQADVKEKDIEGQDVKVQAAEEQEPQEQVAGAKEQEPQDQVAAKEQTVVKMGGADIDTYIREEIFGSKKTMTKTDLGLLLLKKIGAYDDAVLTRMLQLVDEDNSGTIDVNEFQDCIKQLDPDLSFKGLLKKFTLRCLKDISWDLKIIFSSASAISILNNLVSRLDGIDSLWENEHFSPSHYGNWAFSIGMLYFLVDRVSFLRGRYEMKEAVRCMMRSWLTRGVVDETDDDDLSMEPEKMDKGKFNSLLEERGIFVPTFMLDSIYSSIDVDDSGEISYDEIEVYAEQKTNKFSDIVWLCLKDIPFYGSIVWTVGCVLYLVTDYHPNDDVNTVCFQIGGICFFVAAINETVSCIQGKIDTLEYVDNVRKAISALEKNQ